MVDEREEFLEKQYFKFLSQLTKQTNMLQRAFISLNAKTVESRAAVEKTTKIQEELTKRRRSEDRVKRDQLKITLETFDLSKKTLNLRRQEARTRKDIAKILSQDKKDRIADNRLRAQERRDLETLHQEGVKRNILMRRSIQATAEKFDFITSSLTQGRGIIPTLSLLGKGAYNSAVSFKAMNEAEEELNLARKQGDPKTIQAKEKTFLQMQKDFEDRTAGSKILQRISGRLAKAGKFFEKHATGIIIGAGAAGVLIGIIKKALDVSPMFQQMMKLMNFAVTMVLRPIGDFFGFLLRPILIMMLSKFILPWFRFVYPVMKKLGDHFGNIGANVLEKISKGDILGALFETTPLFAGSELKDAIFGKDFKLFGDEPDSLLVNIATMATVVGGTIAAFKTAKAAMNSITNKIIEIAGRIVGGTTTGGNPLDDTITGGSNPSAGTGNVDDDIKNKPPEDPSKPKTNPPKTGGGRFTGGDTIGNGEFMGREEKVIKPANTWSSNENVKRIQKLGTRLDDIIKRRGIQKAIESFVTLMKRAKINKSAILKSLTSPTPKGGLGLSQGLWAEMLVGSGIMTFDELYQKITENGSLIPDWWEQKKRADENFGVDPNIWGNLDPNDETGIAAADGGILNEPVIGFGQNTGRKYTLGERGREAVVPLNKTGGQNIGGGTTVNININNMSGDRQDVEKLRKTILEVLQQTSTNRVRA